MTDDDIGQLTKVLRTNAEDLFKIWMFQPARHADFGKMEIEDIQEVIIGLNSVIRQHNREKLKVVSNG